MPAATNLGNAKKALSASVTQLGGQPTIDEALAFYVPYAKTAADGAASTATADTPFLWTNPFSFPVYVVSGYMTTTGAGITADANNNATITIKTNDGAGGATAIALSITTDVATGNFTANVSKAFTSVTIANTAVPPGGRLWINIAKGGTGVVVPVSDFTVKLYKAES